MTARRVLRTTARTDSARPATATVFQRPLTAWFADWKAQKARSTVTGNAPTRPPLPPAGDARLPG